MMANNDIVIITVEASGTSTSTFHATNVAEQWLSPESEESEETLTKDKWMNKEEN